jgi:hypothetical protein
LRSSRGSWRALAGRIVSGLAPPELSVCSAEPCLSLARESPEIYVKMALIELVKEFRAMAAH